MRPSTAARKVAYAIAARTLEEPNRALEADVLPDTVDPEEVRAAYATIVDALAKASRAEWVEVPGSEGSDAN